MAAKQPYIPSREVQESLLHSHRNLGNDQDELRDRMRSIDLSYLREEDLTPDQLKAKLANARGDANRLQNITIPVVKPQVSAAVDYQISVFLTDYPIFGVVSSPKYIDAAIQLQALIEENSIKMGWVSQLTDFFFDSHKYIGAVEVAWDKITTAAVETDLGFSSDEGRPKQVIWQGNRITRWDPYNTYYDRRVCLRDLPSEGDYAGVTKLYTRTGLKALLNALDLKIIANINEAFESPSVLDPTGQGPYGASFHVPDLSPSAIYGKKTPDLDDWGNWGGLGSLHTRNGRSYPLYEVSFEYRRIIPSDYNLKVPAPNTPQVWRFIWINHSVLIHAERQTNAHEKIPVFFANASEDGLGHQSKSLAEDGQPFQQVASGLMNSVIASRRRAVNDRVLYDPSRVLEAHINNPNPTAKIPVRPSAYGKNVSDAVYPFPFRDDQAGISLQELQQVVAFGNALNGLNPVRQGQFVKGNKTDGQWQDSMSNATSRDQRVALIMEANVFTPLKEVLKLNYAQYQAPATIYSPSQEAEVVVDPIQLRTSVLNFKVTDGLLPKEKQISSDKAKTAMQIIGSSQALAGGYNIAPMFSYLMKLDRVDFSAFEKSPQQQAYEQALGAWNNVAMLAAQKGTEITTPMPKPEDYGYDPATVTPSPNQPGQQPGQQ